MPVNWDEVKFGETTIVEIDGKTATIGYEREWECKDEELEVRLNAFTLWWDVTRNWVPNWWAYLAEAVASEFDNVKVLQVIEVIPPPEGAFW